jgi:hypothetical protein
MSPGFPGEYENGFSMKYAHITEYGDKILKNSINPLDENDYLKQMKSKCPSIYNNILEMYLFEAIQCLKSNINIGAMVLFGGASEALFLEFISLFLTNCFADPSKKASFESSIQNKFIKTKYDKFKALITPLKNNFPRNLKDGFSTWIDHLFNYIRNARNDVSHPSGRNLTRDEMTGLFFLLPSLAEKWEMLYTYFITNKIS